jgi:hypothetical protein
MKARGYKAVLTWEKPVPSGMVRVSACIHKNSLGIAGREDSAMGKGVQRLWNEVLALYKDREISKELYRDILDLLKPLGDCGF